MTAFIEADGTCPFDPTELVGLCMENATQCLLLDAAALPAEFFDLSTGLAGELLHKLSTYRIRLACVLPDPTVHSPRFQDFAREANNGTQCRFFPTREEATRWLESV